jgi:hypothetical protein
MAYRVEILSEGAPMQSFLEVPEKIYKYDASWVPPLKSEIVRTLDARKNPYFANASLRKFVCYSNGYPVARSVAVINHGHWKKFGKKSAFFGFFESTNDKEAVSCLFETISGYCRDAGAEILEGPFNPNHYSELGMLTDNFHTAPAFFETYNPDYYPELIENSGFRVSKRLHTRINTDAGNYLRRRYGSSSFPVGIRDFRVRFISLWNLKSDLEKIREVNNDAFSDNWHFLPLSGAEYTYSAKYLFFVTRPSLIVLIEKAGEPVGVIQFMLNVNPILQSFQGKAGFINHFRFLWKRRSLKGIVLYAAGIKKDYQNSPVAWLMLKAVCSITQGYPVLYTTWMSDDNIPSVRTSEHLGLVPYKWFSIYEKSIDHETHETKHPNPCET